MRYGFCILIVLIGIGLFIEGYFYGRLTLQQKLHSELLFYQAEAQKMQQEVVKMDEYALCLHLGGTLEDCKHVNDSHDLEQNFENLFFNKNE